MPLQQFPSLCMAGQRSPDMCKETLNVLGDRIAYMVYTEAGCAYYGWSYVVDCLLGSISTLGLKVACKLKEMIPDCKYVKDIGCKILVTDLINPYQIHEVDRSFMGKRDGVIVDKSRSYGKTNIFEDERYVVGIIDEGEQSICISSRNIRSNLFFEESSQVIDLGTVF